MSRRPVGPGEVGTVGIIACVVLVVVAFLLRAVAGAAGPLVWVVAAVVGALVLVGWLVRRTRRRG